MSSHAIRHLFLLLIASYCFLGFCSNLLDRSVPFSITLWIFQNILWLVIYFGGRKVPLLPSSWIIGGLIISAVSMSWNTPTSENDFYRYFWDGKRVLEGKNPYSLSPAQALSEFKDQKKWGVIYQKMNHPELSTIYPPLAIALFAGLVFISFESLKCFMLLLSFGGSALSAMFFYQNALRKQHFQPAHLTGLFLLHPLIQKEWLHSCHYDSWLVASMLLAVSWSRVSFQWLGWILGFGLKFVALLGVLTIPMKKSHWALSVIFFLVLGLGWMTMIFIIEKDNPHSGVFQFAGFWEMNSGVFRWVRELCDIGLTTSRTRDFVPRVVVFFIGCIFMIFLFIKKIVETQTDWIFWIFWILVIVSPVANSWYFTWSLPFLLLTTDRKNLPLLGGFAVLPLQESFNIDGPSWIFLRCWDFEHLIFSILVGVTIFRRNALK